MRRLTSIIFFILFWLIAVSLYGRSEWQQLVRKPVVVYCHREDLKNGQRIMSIVENVLPGIEHDLGLVNPGKITIVIASSEKEFATVTGGQIPEWGIGAADPARGIVFLKSPRFAKPETNLNQVVAHELTHVVLGMILKGKDVSRWFDEGLAQYESGEGDMWGTILLARSIFAGEIIWLDDIDNVLNFRRHKAALAYQESRTAIDYLEEHYGRDVLARIIQALKKGDGMDNALVLSIGIGFHEFQNDWYRALKHKYRWYVFMDFPVVLSTLFVILFLTAFFVTRRRMRQKKEIWEKEALHEYGDFEED